MSLRAPQPRWRHAAFGVGLKHFVWGGENRSAVIQTTQIESFDVSSVKWEEPQPLQGSLPERLWGMAVTTDGEKAYTFGGWNGSTRISNIYEINLQTLQCKEIPPGPANFYSPPGISRSRLVYYNEKLVVCGGYSDHGYTHDLYVFDLRKRVWAVQPTTGEKPPPLLGHTFIKADHHRAVLFGGYTENVFHNDTYVLDMKTWNWTKMKAWGDMPSPRYYHDICCITGPLIGQTQSLLLMIGGWYNEKVLHDVWLLDVDKGEWSELTLPVDTTPLCGHSALVFGSGPSFRVVVLFGGYSEARTSETTLLLLDLNGASWQVTRVVKPDELVKPDESLREEMRNLELSPQDKDTQHTLVYDKDTPQTVVTIDLADLDIGDKRLGKGGFGNVYEGYWNKMTVAVKVTQSNCSEALPQEIQVWASLPYHQNIVALIGIALGKHISYIVTELATKGSLYDHLHIQKNTPSVKQSLAWASDVAHGMKHLHDHDITHRDLKSANVLLTSEWVAKICDFGSARELTHTTATDQTGTYRWMSPEIMRAATARINKKCDLFSYGMILFELFAHEIPYADLQDSYEVLMSVMSCKRPPIPHTLPSYLHSLLRSCWEEDPHLRPTFDDFVNVLTKTE